jgi:hypothetical protein
MEKYDYEFKKRLASKINNLKDKKHQINLYRIINNDDKNKDYISINNDEICIKFNRLTDETYNKICEYMNNIIEIKQNNIPCKINYYTPNIIYNNIKLSKREKFILKKIKCCDDEQHELSLNS